MVISDGSMPGPRPVFLEGPKLRVGWSPTFGKGPKNMSNLFSKFKGPSKAKAQNSWKALSLGPARAWAGPVFLGL